MQRVEVLLLAYVGVFTAVAKLEGYPPLGYSKSSTLHQNRLLAKGLNEFSFCLAPKPWSRLHRPPVIPVAPKKISLTDKAITQLQTARSLDVQPCSRAVVQSNSDVVNSDSDADA